MWQKIKKTLKSIQNSDEANKKRWLIGASAASMIIVVGLWLIYLKFTVESGSPSVEAKESVGFWQILKNGLVIIFQSIKENITNFISELSKGKTITIE